MPAAQTIGRDRQLKWLPLDKIVPNERNPRGAPQFKLDQLIDLKRSIEEHGILEPLIVQKYEQGLYMLIEGERRWTVAKNLKLKEVPATIIERKLDADDQVVVMYNLHENRKGWEMADHLKAIQELMKNSPEKTEDELARELGLSLATFRDRLRVLGLGARIVTQISQGKVDYTSALRSAQAGTAIAKKRPELAEKLGGEKKIQEALIAKAIKRGGISHELTAGKQDLTDREHVPDEVIEEYIRKPEAGLRELRQSAPPRAAQRATVRTLAKSAMKIEGELRELHNADLSQAPNLMALRSALSALVEVATELERRITDAILAKETTEQTETVTLRRPAGDSVKELAATERAGRRSKHEAAVGRS